MGYKVSTKFRIDLGELGDNQGTPFFVEIKNPRMFTFGQKVEMAKVQQIPDEIDRVEALKGVVKGLITSWNLIDQETEQPIQPQQEDSLDRVPSEVVEEILKALRPKEDEETKN